MENIRDPRHVTRESIENFLKSNADFTVDHLYNGSAIYRIQILDIKCSVKDFYLPPLQGPSGTFSEIEGYLIESVMSNRDNMVKISRIVRRLQYIDYLLE